MFQSRFPGILVLKILAPLWSSLSPDGGTGIQMCLLWQGFQWSIGFCIVFSFFFFSVIIFVCCKEKFPKDFLFQLACMIPENTVQAAKARKQFNSPVQCGNEQHREGQWVAVTCRWQPTAVQVHSWSTRREGNGASYWKVLQPPSRSEEWGHSTRPSEFLTTF